MNTLTIGDLVLVKECRKSVYLLPGSARTDIKEAELTETLPCQLVEWADHHYMLSKMKTPRAGKNSNPRCWAIAHCPRRTNHL